MIGAFAVDVNCRTPDLRREMRRQITGRVEWLMNAWMNVTQLEQT